ncbi:MAG: hypothetical protein HYY17_06995 [Planctomycetes bacterium]|nr:hypothetical protein [Planctomycetota bacterium]
MSKGLCIGTGIGIGIGICVFAGVFALRAHARPQTEPQQADSNNGPMILGTGGSTQNKNDVCWILFRDGKEVGTVKTKNGDQKLEADRYVLALYRVDEGGKAADLVHLRNVTWDVKLGHMPAAGKTPEDVFRVYALEKLK